jgi:hypothetical protein
MPHWNPVIDTGQDSTVNAGSISPGRGGKTGGDRAQEPSGKTVRFALCSVLTAYFIEIGKNSFAIGSMADFWMPLESVDAFLRKGDRFGVADI